MNVRNLSFVIVLFLVWIMGYYYYSPERLAMRSEEEQNNNIQIPEQPVVEEKIVQEYPAPIDQTNELRRALEYDPLPEVIPTFPVEKTEQNIVSKQIKKKKRTRKEKKKRDVSPAKESFIPQQHKSNNEKSYRLSPSNDEKIKAPINITADLKKKDIGYYKMLSWHYPHFFNLTVNDQQLFTKKDKVITQAESVALSKDEPFVIRYNYEWHTPWGKRIGAKKVTFKPQEHAYQLTVHFKSNWKDEERIVVDGADKISAELLEEEKPAV